MKFILFLAICVSCLLSPSEAAAEETSAEPPVLEAWTDVGATIAFHPKWGVRLQGRWVLSKEDGRDALEAAAGFTRKLWGHGAAHLVAGYAYGDEEHALAITLIKEATFGKGVRTFGYASEQRLRFDGDWSYEGFYRVDAVVAGIHAVHDGTDDIAAGFQIGTGPGYRMARVEMRFSFAVRGDIPERIGAFVLAFDLP